jgi:hypothetical protein
MSATPNTAISDPEAVMEALEADIRAIGYENTSARIIEPSHLPTSHHEDADGPTPAIREVPPTLYIVLVDVDAGPSFIVRLEEGDHFATVQSTYELWRDIADRLTTEQATELVPEDLRSELPEEHSAVDILPPHMLNDKQERLPAIAAIGLLTDVSIDMRREIVYQLTEIFTAAAVKHMVNSPTTKAAPHEFSVFAKVFPTEEAYSLQTLNETVEQVRMAAHRGEQFLRYSFKLGVDIAEETAGDVQDDPEPPGDCGFTEDPLDLN